MNAFEKKLASKISSIEGVCGVPLDEITPGLVIDVHRRGRRVGLLRAGKTYPYYDLASLTKILFTASRAMIHFSEFPRQLDESLSAVLPWWKRRSTTPAGLMTHSAGLEWWLPMYKRLRGPVLPEPRWQQMKKQLAKLKPARRAKAVYSDIDLWMMGAYLEARLERPLLEMWDDVHTRLDLGEVFFHVGNKPVKPRASYAPTEDCPWRRRVLQGEVHDENCWALGGVAPHAGLFGEIEAVSDWGLKLRRAWAGEFSGFGSERMVRHFTGRRLSRDVGDWGLCFMKPSRPKTSCGRYFSVRSFGHTGFTGTSLWFDPVQDLLVVILSNRVHPSRGNSRFVGLRPLLHDWICESL
jgi:CubicO group peptidase (beta-lactamase class C family)